MKYYSLVFSLVSLFVLSKDALKANELEAAGFTQKVLRTMYADLAGNPSIPFKLFCAGVEWRVKSGVLVKNIYSTAQKGTIAEMQNAIVRYLDDRDPAEACPILKEVLTVSDGEKKLFFKIT